MIEEARRRRAASIGGEGEDEEHEAADEAEHRPLDVAGRVAVQGGLGDLLHQLGIGDREVGLDLLEDPLLVLGKRHRRHCRAARSNGRSRVGTACGDAARRGRAVGAVDDPVRGQRDLRVRVATAVTAVRASASRNALRGSAYWASGLAQHLGDGRGGRSTGRRRARAPRRRRWSRRAAARGSRRRSRGARPRRTPRGAASTSRLRIWCQTLTSVARRAVADTEGERRRRRRSRHARTGPPSGRATSVGSPRIQRSDVDVVDRVLDERPAAGAWRRRPATSTRT